MSRRAVLLLTLAALVVLGTAAFPWTLSSGRLLAAVSGYLQAHFGVTIEVKGRSTIAFLPVPRVKLEDVVLTTADDRVRSEGGIFRGELRILPLLAGRIELSEAALSGARVTASVAKLGAIDWGKLLAASEGRDAQRIPRIVLTSTTIRWTDLPQGKLDDVNLVVSWPDTSEAVEVAGSLAWRGESIQVTQVSVNPSILAAQKPSPFSVRLTAPIGHLSASGEAQLGDDPRITGQSAVETPSIRDLSRWSGIDFPLSPLTRGLSVTGDFSATRRRLSWPSVAVTLGNDQLDGTLSVRLDGERPVIAGTLAADSLDLSDYFEPFAQARTLSGAWSEDGLNLARTTGGDLDLRLSASSALLGNVHLGEMAAGILVKPGQIEASLGRASFQGGTLKGRLALARVEGGTEVKVQATFDQIDAASFLGLVGQPRWLSGKAQGQIQIEAIGETAAGLVRQSHGRTTVTVKQGELVGVSLNDLAKRIEKRPLATSIDWKGGRTRFETAHVGLAIASGIGEITEGRLSASDLQTTLQGSVSLVDRTLDAKAAIDSAAAPGGTGSPLIVFDVNGGWETVRMAPDVKSLIQRSGAAKPLFGPDPARPADSGQNPSLPIATAQ